MFLIGSKMKGRYAGDADMAINETQTCLENVKDRLRERTAFPEVGYQE